MSSSIAPVLICNTPSVGWRRFLAYQQAQGGVGLSVEVGRAPRVESFDRYARA